MAPSCQLYSLLVLILVVEWSPSVHGDVTHRTNVRCLNICKEQSVRVAQSHQEDCQRGCRYFNIEFLTSTTGDEEDAIVVDSSPGIELGAVLEQCKTLCRDAYPADGLRRDACDLGCRCMHDIQRKAPVLSAGGGDSSSFVVYMGAGEQTMVVVPELLENTAQSGDSGWVLLNSIFRPSHDYSEVVSSASSSSYKLTETHVQTMPISGGAGEKHRFGDFRRNHSPFCIPAWLWLIPVMLLLALVYIQYNGTSLRNVLVFEEDSSEDDEMIVVPRKEENGFHVTLKDKDTFLIEFQPSMEEFLEAKLQDLPPKYDDHRLAGN